MHMQLPDLPARDLGWIRSWRDCLPEAPSKWSKYAHFNALNFNFKVHRSD